MNASVRICLALWIALLLAVPSPAAERWVWWEGESPEKTNFPDNTWFSARGEEKELLSGGQWLTNMGKRERGEALAVYRVEVPSDGTYDFWVRKMWKHGPFRWRFDRRDWRTCGRDVALADNVTLRAHVPANWVHLGPVELDAGTHRFELRLLAGVGDKLTAAFDAFLLTRDVFFPSGKLKPGERSGRADEGFFAWEPAGDPFTDDALLDLRHLNEEAAGQSGRVSRDGDRLLRGDGEEIRLWAVNVSAGNAAQSRRSIDYLARKLAKLGVNAVRFHSALFDPKKVESLSKKKLDDLHYLVAAMKREGIYTGVSFYFPLWFGVKDGYGIKGFDEVKSDKPFALLLFNERMQQIHRSWMRELLTTPNPYTGTPLAKDPAVAYLEIVNEDSLFFWTFSRGSIPSVQWRKLEKRFGAWLAERYGSVAKALHAWGGAGMDADDPAAGIAGVREVWHMTSQGLRHGGQAKRRRMSDQVRFLAEMQKSYYERTIRHLREELGYDGLVTASNWKTADAELLGALERYTYTAGDVIDRHGYFGGKHEGEGASYSVRKGHTFASRSGLRHPWSLPIQVAQVAGYPQIISEINWPNPNRYRAEMTLLSGAYGRLQGLDGMFFFAVGSNYLRDTSMEKFAVSSPAVAGTFPAAALMYRRGDLQAGPVAVEAAAAPEELYALKGDGLAEAAALDALRRADAPGGRKTGRSPLSLAYYVGKVQRRFVGRAAGGHAGLGRAIDPAGKTVTSATRQIRLDWGRGVLAVASDRAAAAAGFLGAVGPIDFGEAVTIRCGNEYAAIAVVSLDGRDIVFSRKLLIQVMTEERPFGFETEGNRITDLGGHPIGVREIDASVKLPAGGTGRPEANALDENGYPRASVANVTHDDSGWTIHLAPDVVYYVVTRPGPVSGR